MRDYIIKNKFFFMPALQKIAADSLYRNSVYIMLSTGILGFFGFFFWILSARLFSPEQVGVATTLISVTTLLGNLSLLGLNVGLIRYLPKSDEKNEIINSTVMIVTFTTIIASVVFLIGVGFFSSKLLFLRSNMWYMLSFILFSVAMSLNTCVESIFIAFRSASQVLIKSVLLSIQKLLFPFIFFFLASYGIFSSVSLATLTSVIFAFVILRLKYAYQPSFSFKLSTVKKMAVFSGANYIANFISQAPPLLLPVLIINVIGAKAAAYYYIDSMILGLLTIIAGAATQSLLAEGAYNVKELRQHFIKSVKITYVFLIPAVFVILFFGNIILHFFGKRYANESFTFLQIISVSALFMSISSLGGSFLKVLHRVKTVILINFVEMIFLLGMCYLFIHQGLTGIGWGWLLGQILSAILYLVVLWKEVFRKK